MAGLVASFLAAAQRQLSVVGRDLGVPPESVLEELVGGVRQHRRPRRGVTKSCVGYSVHGDGCLFIGRRDRSEIDLDLSPAGAAKFDVWRVKIWAESIGVEDPNDEAITDEAASLVESGELLAVDSWWWALPSGDVQIAGDIPGH
jgi:hypothetical protein